MYPPKKTVAAQSHSYVRTHRYWLMWLSTFALAALLFSGHTRAVNNSQSSEVRQLIVGTAVERELSGGQTHSYQITLTTGQYLQALIEQRGIDVVVLVLAPDGRKVIEVDSPNGTQGPEPVWMIADVAGDYRLEVRSLEAKAAVGRYAVTVEQLRIPTEQDKARVAALRAFGEASQLRQQGTAEAVRQAVIKYEESLPLWQAIGEQVKEAETLSNLGFLNHNYLGETFKARDYHERELPLRRALGDQAAAAVALNNLGQIYFSLGEMQKALDAYGQSLTLRRATGDRHGEAIVLDHLGQVYSQMGQAQQALEQQQQALAIFRALGERRHEGVALANISHSLLNVGEMSGALDYAAQALALVRVSKDQLQEALYLGNIGAIHSHLGQPQQSLEYYQQALALYRRLGNSRLEAYALAGIGAAHLALADYPQATGWLQQALVLLQAAGDRRGVADTLHKLGVVYRLSGDWRQAETSLTNALSLSQAAQDISLEAQILDGLALVKQERGALASARGYSEQALALTESLRARVASQQARATFLASKQSFYEHYIDLLMQMHQEQPNAGNERAALQASERTRARSLLELLTEARAEIRQGADTKLLAQARALQTQLNARAAAQTRLLNGKPTEAQTAAIAKEIADLTARLQEIETQIRVTSPRYAALTQPQPLNASEIQQLLDDDTLLLEYALGEKNSYLWAVTQTAINSYQLPPRAEIEAAARKVYDLLTARQPQPGLNPAQQSERVKKAETEYPTQIAALSRMLLAPVAGQLGNKRLVIVPSGMLEYLPFAALTSPSAENKTATAAPLLVNHEVINLPSASVLAVLRREAATRTAATKSVAVLADPVFTPDDPRVGALSKNRETAEAANTLAANRTPPAQLTTDLARAVRTFNFAEARGGLARLPFSREEAETILALAPRGAGLKALSFAANRQTATSPDLSQYRLIHFATHGLLNSEHPELSGLVFSLVDETGKAQDGFLRLHEIFNLRLSADLVVLSACQTGIGKQIKGEGLVGLTRGFMYAGAPRVMASLWQVNDLATAELMKHFYRGLLKDGMRPAAALRAAQLELLKGKQWAMPYYWAAFVLQGEWR